MIQINLLDQNSQRGRGRWAGGRRGSGRLGGGHRSESVMLGDGESTDHGGSGWLVLIVFVIMAALNGYVGWKAYARVAEERTALMEVRNKVKSRQAMIDERLTEAEQWRRYRDVVLNQMDVLRSLDPPDRILWSEKVNMLANLMPPEVFLDKIQLIEETKMVETAQSKEALKKWENALDKEKRGAKPEKVEKPIITYKLSLTGLAVGSDNVQQAKNMLKLQDALRNYSLVDQSGVQRQFMTGFLPDIDYGHVTTKLYTDTPVNEFELKLTSVSFGEDTTPAASTKTDGRSKGLVQAKRMAKEDNEQADKAYRKTGKADETGEKK